MDDLNEFLGKEVYIVIDRPLGSVHPNDSDIVYPVNYGYIPNTVSGDGEEIDVYLLGVSVPVRDFVCRIIAVVVRLDDNENKLVAAPVGAEFTKEEIESLISFQEQYFDTRIITEV
ncbi:MAG: inorganic diphosphatase [Clostridia bacterium]|nr:inorganic diphosphatase [Clostridia bacterium]